MFKRLLIIVLSASMLASSMAMATQPETGLEKAWRLTKGVGSAAATLFSLGSMLDFGLTGALGYFWGRPEGSGYSVAALPFTRLTGYMAETAAKSAELTDYLPHPNIFFATGTIISGLLTYYWASKTRKHFAGTTVQTKATEESNKAVEEGLFDT